MSEWRSELFRLGHESDHSDVLGTTAHEGRRRPSPPHTKEAAITGRRLPTPPHTPPPRTPPPHYTIARLRPAPQLLGDDQHHNCSATDAIVMMLDCSVVMMRRMMLADDRHHRRPRTVAVAAIVMMLNWRWDARGGGMPGLGRSWGGGWGVVLGF
ncbi:hypothetical protein E3N88_24751 [Mikania micrantha]|uniref:Uncharacterized protein n=1 Tax=Mikania micrantha TaxID=192012 RepID=A0A5N6N426_9ASTR|nr:hypothetical protein E3N88_24751 [Mikania micrantha]